MKIAFSTELKQFGKQGEKTGWTYVEVSQKLANKLEPGIKKSFRIKGSIDAHQLKQVALLPMGDGNFIMPVNGVMRKAIHKQKGDNVSIVFEPDKSELKLSKDFLECLADEPAAQEYFSSMPKSHQQYYSKWIESAKTEPTKIKRIAIVVNGLARKLDYGAMLREQRDLNLIR